MFKKFAVAGVTSLIAVSAFAMNPADLKETVALKDGSTVYVFLDGKMGMENPYGRAVPMPEGQAMVTADGKTVRMVGNEVARVSSLIQIES
ncbi:MAG: CopK family periplasmic copper-binding protein [Rhodocyclales bacterium]|nr:CopK family periplasmic copper-binding protein [Rhodocyclales bacterium]